MCIITFACFISYRVFVCIATDVYGYPNDEAADIALGMVRRWLEKNSEKVNIYYSTSK